MHPAAIDFPGLHLGEVCWTQTQWSCTLIFFHLFQIHFGITKEVCLVYSKYIIQANKPSTASNKMVWNYRKANYHKSLVSLYFYYMVVSLTNEVKIWLRWTVNSVTEKWTRQRKMHCKSQLNHRKDLVEEAVGRYSGSQCLLLNFYRIKLNLQTNTTCDINTSFYYSTIKNYNFSFADRKSLPDQQQNHRFS